MRLKSIALALTVVLSPITASAETLEIHGSTTVAANIMMPKKAEIEKAAGVEIQVVGNGSGRGLADLVAGKVKLAMISAPLEDEVRSMKAKGEAVDEGKLQGHRVGTASVAFVVHPSNPVKSLTDEQTAGILAGSIKNWKEVGGPDKPIVVVLEGKGGGIRSMAESAFLKGGDVAAQKRELPNATQVVKVVGQLDAAIGLAAKSSVTAEVTEIKAGKELVQPLILVTVGEPSPDVAKVIAAAKAAGGG